MCRYDESSLGAGLGLSQAFERGFREDFGLLSLGQRGRYPQCLLYNNCTMYGQSFSYIIIRTLSSRRVSRHPSIHPYQGQ